MDANWYENEPEETPEEPPFHTRNCRCALIPFVENAYYFLPDFIDEFLDKLLGVDHGKKA